VTAAERVVVAFDFDGTLTTKDTVVPFLLRLEGRGKLVLRLAARPVALCTAALHRDRDRFKALAVHAAFAGRSPELVGVLGAGYAATVHSTLMRADTLQRMAWHRDQGHTIVLVSASLGAYLHPVGALLGVDAVLCTEAVVGPDGRYTGRMAGDNCRGPEKVRRLRAWLAEHQLADAELWAYGDSNGDRELLAAAAHPLMVKGVHVTAVPADAR